MLSGADRADVATMPLLSKRSFRSAAKGASDSFHCGLTWGRGKVGAVWV